MVTALDIATATKYKLKNTLKKFKNLFRGRLGKVDIHSVDLEVEEETKLFATTYYNIPKMYEKPFHTKVDRMVDINILKRLKFHKDSQWASPSFCQMKKTGDLRILTDFREVNKRITRKPFPLPWIMESLQKIEKFRSATAIDLYQ